MAWVDVSDSLQANNQSTPSSQTQDNSQWKDVTDQVSQGSDSLDTSAWQSGSSNNEQQTPLGFGQTVNMGSIRTPEYKAKYAQHLFPSSQVSIEPDTNRISVTSPQGNTTFIEPHRDGAVNWLKDNARKLTEFIGDQGLPIMGQIGADVSALPMAAAAGLPTAGVGGGVVLAGANAIGAGIGRGLQQAHNNEIIGEPYSGGDVALQGAAGAASVPIAAAMAPVTKGAVTMVGKLMGKLSEPLGDALPSVGEAVLGVPHMNTEWLQERLKSGVPATDIINEVNASSDRGGNIVRNLMFGSQKAEDATPGNFIKQYQRLIKPNINDTGATNVLDEFLSKSTGLNQDTLDVMKNKSASEILSPGNTDPRAWRSLADYAVNSIDAAQAKLSDEYGAVKKAFIAGTKDQTLNISPFVKQMQDGLQNLRVIDGDSINPNYTGTAAKKAYEDVLSKLKVIMGGSEEASFSRNEGSRALRMSPEAFSMLQGKSSPFDLSKMKVSDVLKFKAEVQPMLDKAFEGTGLSQTEKRPLAQFLGKMDDSLYSLKGSEPMKAMNQKYANFQTSKSLFKTLQDGDLGEQQGVISQLRQSLSKDPTTRATSQSYISDLDNQLQNKILPKLQTLGAAQDIQGTNFTNSVNSLVGSMKQIHQTGLSPDKAAEVASGLKLVDNSVKQPGYKFYDNFRDHLTAEAYNNPKQNIFKARLLNGLVGVGAVTAGHPVIGAGATLAAMGAFSPKGVGNMIIKGSQVPGAIDAGLTGAGKIATSPVGRALLSSLIKKKTGL